jgi:hypothetical protein
MRFHTLYLFIGILLTLCSCRSDFETVPSSGKLTFSKDTIYLDTVFTNISSSTYSLKVYNKSKNDITIPSIKLGKGLSSKYRMTVDGLQENKDKTFNNITLLAKDSLYIFIETTASSTDANPTDFLYTDQILFDSGTNLQKVELVTLIQDAVFLYPKQFADGTSEKINIGDQKIDGFYLDEDDPTNGNELHFSNKKPYVIYGYAAVPPGKKAVFDSGAKVFFHANSGFIVDKNASVNINGTSSITKKLENEVVFEGDRLETNYANIPGQWGTFWLADGSTNNKINHLTIKNATIGIHIEDNDGTTVALKNIQIYNCTNYGILAQKAKIEGENIVINSAGKASLACLYGGDYKFTHCTFNNNWPDPNQVALTISNTFAGATPDIEDLTQATFNNCIIYGSYTDEINLNKKSGATFEYQFNNCLLKFNSNSSNPNYQFATDPAHYTHIILNKDPKFQKTNQNKLNIDATSSAFAKGNSLYLIPFDILGIARTLPPDLGGYQNATF